jgi:two-component system, OmpR family, response regulator
MHPPAGKPMFRLVGQSNVPPPEEFDAERITRQARGRIAILAGMDETREQLRDIALDLGCDPEFIDDWAIDRIEARRWTLVIIVSTSNPAALILRVAMASRFRGTRVLVVSDDRDTQHIADVLVAGADDYVLMPFDPVECRARIQALIAGPHVVTERRKQELVFDFSKRTITSGSMFVALSAREWDVLISLLESDGRPMRADELATLIWGDARAEIAAVSTISRIRRRLHSHQFEVIDIVTVPGQGYRAVFRRLSDSLTRQSLRPLSD